MVSQILPDGALRLLAPARFKKPALLPPRSRFPKDTTRRQRQGPAFYLRGAAFPPPPPCPCPWGSHPPFSPHRTRLRTQKCCSEAGMFYSWSDRYWQRIAATLLGKLSFNSSSDSFGFCFVVVFCVWFFFFSQINTRFKRPRSNNNFLKKSSLVGFGGQGEE